MSKAHPWNQNFIWQNRPISGLRHCTPEQVDRFNRDGFCILEQVVSNTELTRLLAEIDPVEQAGGGSTLINTAGAELASYKANELTFTCNLVARSSDLAAFYGSQIFANITHDLIGNNARLYWDQAVYKHPQKGGEFPWHQDNGYTFVRPQHYLTCWLALADAPVSSGCPWVIPGAHKNGTYTHVQESYGLEIKDVERLLQQYGEIPAPVKAGDMVVFSSLTPHKTGPNISPRIRKALIIQFIPDGAVRVEQAGDIVLNDAVLNPQISG